jgi:hypothetical protein
VGTLSCPDRKSIHKERLLAGVTDKKWEDVSFDHRIKVFRKCPSMPVEAVFPTIHEDRRLRRRFQKAMSEIK